MMKITLVALALVAAFAAGSVATAATGWRVFATASDEGEYGTFVSANAKVLRPKVLGIRAFGPVEELTWELSCSGEVKAPGLSGKAVTVTVANSKSCSIYGSAGGAAGTLRVQLLRK